MAEDGLPKGTLDRGLAMLDYLAEATEATAAQLAMAGGMSRSAVYRLIERLNELGYLEPTASSRWRLGASATRLAMAASRNTDVIDVAPEFLRVLVQQTRETVGLAVLSGNEMVFVYRERGPHPAGVSVELGQRRPLHATAVGKAYLLGLGSNERDELLRNTTLDPYTSQTITRPGDLLAQLQVARKRGWTEEHGELAESSVCCGAPILDHQSRSVAAISVAGLAARMDPALNRLGQLMSATAEAISRRLGWNARPRG